MSRITRFGVSVPQELIEQFDELIRAKKYRNRSEAIRDLIRDYLVANEWEIGAGQVTGTVTIVYDHHVRELSGNLTSLQHDSHDVISCSTHVHLDEHNCLEVIVLHGTPEQVKSVADRLISARGVKHGKLVCTTTGRKLA